MGYSKFLVVLDTESDNSGILEKAELLALRYEAQLILSVVILNSALESSHTFDPKGLDKARAAYIDEREKWLANFASELSKKGIEVSVKVVWARPSYQGMIDLAIASEVELIIKATRKHSLVTKTLFTNTDWHLIRETPVPVMFVKGNPWGSSIAVAAAVDPMHEQEQVAKQDERLVACARELCCRLPAELNILHAVEPLPSGVVMEFDAIVSDYSSYLNSVREKHRESLAKLMREDVEPNTRVLFEEGPAKVVLPEAVNKYGLDILVMGAVSRSGLEKIFVGSTAEQVLDDLECDVLVLRAGSSIIIG